MKHLVSLLVAVLATVISMNAQYVTVPFQANQSTLSTAEVVALQSKLAGCTIDAVVGYASQEGGVEQNKALSEARAAFVAQSLSASMDIVQGAGATTQFGTAASNRVVIVFYHKKDGNQLTIHPTKRSVDTVMVVAPTAHDPLPDALNDMKVDSSSCDVRGTMHYINGWTMPCITDTCTGRTYTYTFVPHIYAQPLQVPAKQAIFVEQADAILGDTCSLCRYERGIWLDAEAEYRAWLDTWRAYPSLDSRANLAESQVRRTKARTNYHRCVSYCKRTGKDNYGEPIVRTKKRSSARLVGNGLAKRPSVVASHIACWLKGRKA